MLKRWLFILPLAVVGLAFSGCRSGLPGDDLYQVGAARIGGAIHVFAPLCRDERIASVEAYDNEAWQESGDDSDTERFTYWKVADPVDDSVARGWIVIGDDPSYRRVLVPQGAKTGLPEIVGLSFRVNDPETGRRLGAVFYRSGVPTYPAGSDPRSVKYAFDMGSKNPELLTAGQIRERLRCGKDQPG